MAGQKPGGRGSGSARQGAAAGPRPGSPTARPAAAKPNGNRSANGAARTGNAGGSNGSRGGATAATAAQARPGNGKGGSTKGGATKPGTGTSAGQVTGPRGGNPVTRLLHAAWSPFGSMGGLPLATLVLSLYAVGASIYLTIAHFDTHVTLACSDKGIVNCAEVTTSSQSMVFGIFPVAVLGLAFYVFMVALNSPWGWRLERFPLVRWTRLGAVVVGMGFVLYLVYVELIQIGAICLWCTSVHVATFLIFALIVFYATMNWGKPVTTNRA